MVGGDRISVAGRGGDRGVQLLGQVNHLGESTPILDPGASHDDRPLSCGQQGSSPLHRPVGTGWQVDHPGSRRVPRRVEIGGAGQHVAGQVQVDGPSLGGQRHPERLANHFGDPFGRRDGPGPLRDGAEQGVLIDLLEGVAVYVAGGQCTGQGHHRREGCRGLGHPGDQVGGTGAVLPG